MKTILTWLFWIFAFFFGVNSCQQSEWFKSNQEQQRQEMIAKRTPHVIREADGCKVYAFEDNNLTHYFTRCPDSKTVTEGVREECHSSGKTRTCKKVSEIIE